MREITDTLYPHRKHPLYPQALDAAHEALRKYGLKAARERVAAMIEAFDDAALHRKLQAERLKA